MLEDMKIVAERTKANEGVRFPHRLHLGAVGGRKLFRQLVKIRERELAGVRLVRYGKEYHIVCYEVTGRFSASKTAYKLNGGRQHVLQCVCAALYGAPGL